MECEPHSIPLTEGRIVIRPYNPYDAIAHYQAVIETPKLRVDFSWWHADYTLYESEGFIKSASKKWCKEYNFAIIDAVTGRFLGSCSLQRLDDNHNVANLTIWVRSTEEGKGIAKKAVQCLVRFGCQQQNLRLIEIRTRPDNIPIKNIAKSVGAMFIGTKELEQKTLEVYHKVC